MLSFSSLLGDELFSKVSEKLGDLIKSVNDKFTEAKLIQDDGKLIPKYRFDEVVNQKNDYQTQASELEKQLGKLKKDSKDNEELTSKLETMQNQMKDFQTQAEKKEKNIQKKFALRDALRESGAKHPDLLEQIFELEKLEIDDKGKIKDFENILKPYKESYKDLFGEIKLAGYKPIEDGRNPILNDPKFMTPEEKMMGFYKK